MVNCNAFCLSYKIRNAKLEDMSYIISLAKNEGWNPGIDDGVSFFAADNSGFFIGELDGKPISCISAVRYQDFGFIGLYIVEAEHRGKGYGITLWNHAMEYLSGCNRGLDGVIAQQENYKKSGFWLANRNMRFEGQIVSFPDTLQNEGIISASHLPFDQLISYDRLHFPSERSAFLKSWLFMPHSRSLACIRNSEIIGLGTIRKCFTGYKIGPLFADNFNIAENLFLQLTKYAKGENVYLDISGRNKNAAALVKKYNMKFVFETARMYTGQQPGVRREQIYGITSFELG